MLLWELVKRVSDRYGRRLQEHQKSHTAAQELRQVSVQQFQYLQVIQSMPVATASALAAYFKVRAPSTTALLSRLEEQGFVKRRPDPKDGRIQQIYLSPRGKRILEMQESAFQALAGDIEKILTPGELETYSRLTLKICEAFEKEERGEGES